MTEASTPALSAPTVDHTIRRAVSRCGDDRCPGPNPAASTTLTNSSNRSVRWVAPCRGLRRRSPRRGRRRRRGGGRYGGGGEPSRWMVRASAVHREGGAGCRAPPVRGRTPVPARSRCAGARGRVGVGVNLTRAQPERVAHARVTRAASNPQDRSSLRRASCRVHEVSLVLADQILAAGVGCDSGEICQRAPRDAPAEDLVHDEAAECGQQRQPAERRRARRPRVRRSSRRRVRSHTTARTFGTRPHTAMSR